MSRASVSSALPPPPTMCPRLSSLYVCTCFPASQRLISLPLSRWSSHSFPLSLNSSPPSLLPPPLFSSVTLTFLPSAVRNPKQSDSLALWSAWMQYLHSSPCPVVGQANKVVGQANKVASQFASSRTVLQRELLPGWSVSVFLPDDFHGLQARCCFLLLKRNRNQTDQINKKTFLNPFPLQATILFFLHLFRRIPWMSCLSYFLQILFPYVPFPSYYSETILTGKLQK